MLKEVGSINKWLVNVSKERSSMDICQMDNLVYRAKNLITTQDESYISNDENKNLKKIETTLESQIEQTTLDGIIIPRADELNVNTDIDFENIRTPFTDESCTSESEPDEEVARYYETVNDYGKVQYWKFNCNTEPIENRLQPQLFQHHTLPPRLFRDNDIPYIYTINLKCPKSANEVELENYKLMTQQDLKKNAMTYRYSRQYKVDNSKIEHLCRMCPFKRWIPKERFYEHMGLAHGLFLVENLGYIGLPPPDALFRLSPGYLKCYYGKCPKCWKWIRFGKLAEVGIINKQLQIDDSINDDIEVIGLYTNYFMHFFNCSQEEEEDDDDDDD